jgi:hypothetical protein
MGKGKRTAAGCAPPRAGVGPGLPLGILCAAALGQSRAEPAPRRSLTTGPSLSSRSRRIFIVSLRQLTDVFRWLWKARRSWQLSGCLTGRLPLKPTTESIALRMHLQRGQRRLIAIRQEHANIVAGASGPPARTIPMTPHLYRGPSLTLSNRFFRPVWKRSRRTHGVRRPVNSTAADGPSRNRAPRGNRSSWSPLVVMFNTLGVVAHVCFS